jgi:hypothetical protein
MSSSPQFFVCQYVQGSSEIISAKLDEKNRAVFLIYKGVEIPIKTNVKLQKLITVD